MLHGADHPIQGLSGAEAAEILDVHELTVAKMVARGAPRKPAKHLRRGLDRDEVERGSSGGSLVMRTFACATEAAETLGIKKPVALSVEHDGRRFYRRHQLGVVANARESRLLGPPACRGCQTNRSV